MTAGVPGSASAGTADVAEPAAVCDAVSYVYRRGGSLFGSRGDRPDVQALEDVSLRLHPGELTVIAGASGSGKSTLLHLLGALTTPTAGSVTVDDVDTAALSERERGTLRRRYVGLVFQRFHLLPALSARANVALPLLEEGVRRGQRRERARSLLERVGLGDRLTHRPGELSGGEQQRVAIARALVNEPDLVLADEPTGELDTETGSRVLDVLRSIAEERAVVVATHDERVIEEADRLIELRDGTVIGDERER